MDDLKKLMRRMVILILIFYVGIMVFLITHHYLTLWSLSDDGEANHSAPPRAAPFAINARAEVAPQEETKPGHVPVLGLVVPAPVHVQVVRRV